MKKLLLILALAPAVFAQTADLQIHTYFPTRETLQSGDRVTITMRWRNMGPDTAHDVVATVGAESGAFVLTAAGTSNWPCEPLFGNEGFSCRGTLAVGAEAEMVVSMLAPARDGRWFVNGSVAASTPDPRPDNNTMSLPFTLTASSKQANLSIVPRTQTHDVSAGARVMIPVAVRNGGQQDADDVKVVLGFEPATLIPINASGSGWSCFNATHSPWLITCTRSKLAANSEASILVDVPAMPRQDATYRFQARVAAERSFDTAPGNELAVATVNVGARTEYARVLVPLIPNVTPGANGARWKAETTLLIRSDEQIELGPDPCAFSPVCPPVVLTYPLQRPFPLTSRFADDVGGLFVYTLAKDIDKLDVGSRVYDVARLETTAGSAIAIPREEDFVARTISLLGIPVAPQYRHTLRVYDFEGRAGARVAVRVYANDDREPRGSFVQTLTLSRHARTYTDQQLPTHPAYLQLDPGALVGLAGATTIRLDVEPLDGSRIWAFVSITNNDTHHVTTFSAQ
jgi:hypothetical protein